MAYGSVAGVAALVPRFANAAGVFDSATTPAAADVTAWLAQISAMLDVALAGHTLPTPVTDAAVKPMLDGYANAQAAAVARGVNGLGRFAERQASADEMLVAVDGDIASWVTARAVGIAALLGVVPDAIDASPPPVVTFGRFTRVDGYTGRATEYATEDTI